MNNTDQEFIDKISKYIKDNLENFEYKEYLEDGIIYKIWTIIPKFTRIEFEKKISFLNNDIQIWYSIFHQSIKDSIAIPIFEILKDDSNMDLFYKNGYKVIFDVLNI